MEIEQETAELIAEQKRWLREWRETTGASWTDLARALGIPSGTLSQFGSDRGYSGDQTKIADKIARHRETLSAQANLDLEWPSRPGFFETPTSRELQNMLSVAQSGRIVCAAYGAGLGKTQAIRDFQIRFDNVFVATIAPSSAGVNNMQIEMLEALGDRNAVGTPQKLSRRIRDKVKDLSLPLLVFDEAQHLSEKALEEIRSWHDLTDVGIALFGNATVLQKLGSGTQKAAFAQLYSRLGMKKERPLPRPGDVEALADAWSITDARARAYLHKICMVPGALRGGTHTLELATMFARADRVEVNISHLQDAWAQLSARPVAA